MLQTVINVYVKAYVLFNGVRIKAIEIQLFLALVKFFF